MKMVLFPIDEMFSGIYNLDFIDRSVQTIMENRYYKILYLEEQSLEFASPDQIDRLIRENKADRIVERIFPYRDLLRDGSNSIKGSKNFLISFDEVDCEKMDLIEPLKNIKYLGFDETKEILLQFSSEEYGSEPLETIGTYDFTNRFLDENFKIKKFVKFCAEKEFGDLLDNNINELMNRLPEQRKQYRFLKFNNKWFLRALTSEKYNNYDNHLAIYISLVALSDYADSENLNLLISNSYVTDSDIKLNIIEEKLYKVNEKVSVQFGFLTTNNELTEGTFSLQFSYKVYYNDSQKFKALSNYIFDFNHTITAERLEKQLTQALSGIEQNKRETLEYIRRVYSEKLSENQLYSIFKVIRASKNKFSTDTKEKAAAINDEFVGNTYGLIELFNRLNEITSDIDERIYLERIYHDVITDLYGRKV